MADTDHVGGREYDWYKEHCLQNSSAESYVLCGFRISRRIHHETLVF